MKWYDIFKNSDGKLSGSGFTGVVMGVIASLCFLLEVIAFMFKTNTGEITGSTLTLAGIAAALLGVRKMSAKGKFNIDNKEDKMKIK